MTISGTLSSALSGLTAASRAAELISSNIANAMTDGYARRDLQLGARRVGDAGQGVQINGVGREVNQILLRDLRLARSGAEGLETRAAFHRRLESMVTGTDSIAARIDSFDAALIAAAARPDSEARLGAVLDSARSLVGSLRSASDTVQRSRLDADSAIAADVAQVNRALTQIAALNGTIAGMAVGGRDSSALQDQRQQLIDGLAATIPLREVPDNQGRVALYTSGGAVLLDGRPAQLGFTPVNTITPDMTLASGALSGLTLNGIPLRSDDGGPLAGGRLAAHFAIRDTLAPEAQVMLDAIARDLVERFEDPGLDPTRLPGGPGLFTDRGVAFDPADEAGLSQRLALAASADPAQGGAVWRLRDGLGASVPGPAGESRLLDSLVLALNLSRGGGSGPFAGMPQSLSSLAGTTLANLGANRLTAEAEAGFATARAGALDLLHKADGVDTDREMQHLLLVEQAFAANARVVKTVDEMIQLLLGM
ncbi:MAG: flagellar hook-associated protein FlgK [Pseudorhodobacter sp.]